MVSGASSSKLWVGGLASGLDTQGLIDKLIAAERIPIDQIGKKRDVLQYQRTMLQDINLKLFELQNKATDLTFTRTFNNKKVESTNSRMVSAVAATSASVGSHTVVVKQIATATKALSVGQLARPLERGQYLQSLASVGGSNLTLGQIGATAGSIQVDTATGSHNLDLAGITADSTVGDAITAINAKIDANTALKGKLRARYNQTSNQVEFHLFDNTQSLTIKNGSGTIVSTLFGGQVTSDKNTPIQRSTLALRSGGDTRLSDLGLAGGVSMKLAWGGQPDVNFALSGDMTLSQAVSSLNHQIDLSPTLTKSGVATGNPNDRKIEFRIDEASGKLQLINTNTGASESFIFSDVGGNFTKTMFAASSMASTRDTGRPLVSQSMATKVTNGTITVDGVQIQINSSSDSLQDVLTRITNSTGINATYDASRDTIKLTRKDGKNLPIGLGSGADTSNFLAATFLLSGNQQGSAQAVSTGSIGGVSAAQAATLPLQDAGLPLNTAVIPGTGALKITVDGTVNTVSYDTATDSINTVLDRIKELDGVADAFLDAATGKVTIVGASRGSTSSIGVADQTGNLAAALNLNGVAASGTAVSTTLESSHAIADIQVKSTLSSAGFTQGITAGTFTINGVQFNVLNPATMTVQNVIDAINTNTKAGVRAEYDSQNGRFILTSLRTGNTAVSVGAAGDTSNLLSVMGMDRAAQEIGQNAIFSIQGMYGGAEIVRQSNSVSDVLQGTTLTLSGVTSSAGETITVSADTETAKKAIDEFIKLYNEVTDLVYDNLTQTRLKGSDGAILQPLTETERSSLSSDEVKDYEAKLKVGLLNGDTTLSSVRTRMREVMTAIVPGLDSTMKSLAAIGITTGAVGSAYTDTQRGRLTITDTDKLMEALKTNPDKVADVFGKDAASTGQMGIARRLKATLNEFTKSDGFLTRRVGRSGAVSASSSMDRQIALLNKQITAQEDALARKEDSLIKQYAQLETTISNFQSQSQAFQSQLAKLG